MVFSSVIFLCFFLPAVFILYNILPTLKLKNILLTIVSILFYAYGEPIFVFYLLFIVLIHYLAGKAAVKKNFFSKKVLTFLLVTDILTLFIFKYTGFFVENLNLIFKLALPVPSVSIPIGISFFTFQIMSYAIDSYRDKNLIQNNFFDLLLYISFFPQLIAGPIIKYTDINIQLKKREITVEKQAVGLRRFITGLAKKVIISNTLAVAADTLFLNAETVSLSMPEVWLASASFSLQLYYDFSGYSDMAIGLGQFFGFEFPENFNYPFSAASINDFWKRWHISLTSWLREYVYFPLGGNRKSKIRTLFNIFIVFLITGIWHGANYTFILWGIYNAVFMIAERSGILPVNKIKIKALGRLYTVFVSFTGFIIFKAADINTAFSMIKSMFDFKSFTPNTISAASANTDIFFAVIMIIAIIFCFPITGKIKQLIENKTQSVKTKKALNAVSYLFSLVLLIICIIFLVTNSYNPFIYFNF